MYAIDKIEKFSLRKDFVVFSLVTQPQQVTALSVDTKPAVNQQVYAVGNALGTGVVIRGGLYTSNTPEEQAGKHAFVDGQLKALLAMQPDQVFPHGTGSDRLLHSPARLKHFPALIVRNAAGEWKPVVQKGPKKTPVSDNGYVSIGLDGQNLLFHLRKPDSVTDQKLYRDPVQMMDLLLKPGFFQRRVGSNRIKVTSMGKPVLDTSYTDRWQRHWQVREWPTPYANRRVIVLSLPVPDGYVGIMRNLPASQEHDYLINMEAMTNFFYTAYNGTLAQWKEFLKNKPLLPDAFKTIQIKTDYGKRFSYASPRVKFSFTPQLQKIQPGSELTLGFSYFSDHGKVVWNVADVHVKMDAHDNDWINIQRHAKPPVDLDQAFKARWHKVSHQLHPFDAVARNDNDVMKISAVVDPSDKNSSVRYTALYAREGTHPQDDMKAKLDLLMKDLQVHQ